MNPYQPLPASSGAASNSPVPRERPVKAPLCFVVDSDRSLRHFLSLIMHGTGVHIEEFPDAEGMIAGLRRRTPEAVFLDVTLDLAEAIGCV